MAVPPPYDPTGWSDTDPSTWPQPIPPATLYQPGMAWTMTAPGVVAGQPVDVGDLLFVVHRPRLYGDGNYGDGMFGSTPDADWSSADVTFLAWYSSAPPEDQPPFPYSGCRFGATGWWIIVDAFYIDRTDSRRYGQDDYGDGVYGGGSDETARWVDITPGFVDITITRGAPDGNPSVDAVQIDVSWYDPDFARVDVSPPAWWFRPFVGTPLRVSFYGPSWDWHPRAAGSIETITDPSIARSSDQPRFAAITAFGSVRDLARTLPGWQRPAEPASSRFAALLAAGGWRYGAGDLVYPPDVWLHADVKPEDVTAREEIDRTALSAAWTFDTDRRGMPRLRPWPLDYSTPVVEVVDCADVDGDAVATLITFTADESQLLNLVTVGNKLDPPAVVSVDDPVSIAVYGGRDNSLGFPALDLAFATAGDGAALARRVLARYGRTVTHPDPVTADTYVDARWLPILADADTGQAFDVTRTHPTGYTAASILVALTETITPDRIEATLSLTTITPTT